MCHLELAYRILSSTYQLNASPLLTKSSEYSRAEQCKSEECMLEIANETGSGLLTHLDQHKPKKEYSHENMYATWCVVKTAQQTSVAIHNLELLTAGLFNEETVRKLSSEAFASLPDFALLHLCQSTTIIDTLATGQSCLPTSTLTPSMHASNMAELSWFRVLRYSKSLLQRCFWGISTSYPSSWALQCHCLTPAYAPQAQAMVSFLQHHFTPFAASCKLPSLPPFISIHVPPSLGQPPTSCSFPLSSPAMSSKEYDHLMVTENELTVMWFKPCLPELKHHLVNTKHPPMSRMDVSITEKLTSESLHRKNEPGVLLGLFAFNNKSLRSLLPTNLGSCGVKVIAVSTSEAMLSYLIKEWDKLQSLAKTYLDTEAIPPRPLSRSPSKQKKSEKAAQKVPTELQVSCCWQMCIL